MASTQQFNKETVSKSLEICNLLVQKCSEVIKTNKLCDKFVEVYDLTTKLKYIQRDYTIQRTVQNEMNRSKAVEALVEHFSSLGYIHDALEVIECDGSVGVGLRTNKGVERHERLMTIPRDEMLCVDGVPECDLGRLFRRDALLQKKPNVCLALLLLRETLYRTSSKHQLYIESLPLSPTCALFLEPAHIKMLTHSSILADVVKLYMNLCGHYHYLLTKFVDQTSRQHKKKEPSLLPSAFCFEDFQWAVAIVMTRNNFIPSSDGSAGVVLSLIPVWDLLNHKDDIEVTTDFDVDSASLVFYSPDDFEPGSEIFMNYGQRSTIEHFLYSGFVPSMSVPTSRGNGDSSSINLNDKYRLRINFNQSDPLFKLKKDVLAKLAIDCEYPVFEIQYASFSGLLSDRLRLYLSTMLLKQEHQLLTLLSPASNALATDSSANGEMKKRLEALIGIPEIVKFLSTRTSMYSQILQRYLDSMQPDPVDGQARSCAEFLRYETSVLSAISHLCLLATDPTN